MFSGEIKSCIMDTGTSLIALPPKEFASLSKQWQSANSGVICSSEMCYIYSSCASLAKTLKPIRFKFESQDYFSLPPLEYLINGTDIGVPGYCVFGVQGGLDPTLSIFIIGDAFLRSYYNIYDFDNQRIGLALHKYSAATITSDDTSWPYLVIIGSIVFIIVALLVYYVYRSRREK